MKIYVLTLYEHNAGIFFTKVQGVYKTKDEAWDVGNTMLETVKTVIEYDVTECEVQE